MATSDLDGRELREAVARAMGWAIVPWVGGGAWLRPGRGSIPTRNPDPTEREMLAWLHERDLLVNTMTRKEGAEAYAFKDVNSWLVTVRGRDLREALGRLVLAVAQREAKQ